jgi:hypothetical protein
MAPAADAASLRLPEGIKGAKKCQIQPLKLANLRNFTPMGKPAIIRILLILHRPPLKRAFDLRVSPRSLGLGKTWQSLPPNLPIIAIVTVRQTLTTR